MIGIYLKILSKDVLGRSKYTHTTFQSVMTDSLSKTVFALTT